MTMLQKWKQWAEHAPGASEPQILAGDVPALRRLAEMGGAVHWKSWEEFRDKFRPWDNSSSPLHIGLVPMPYAGDVMRAKVLFLLLNPGLSATDYFAEYQVEPFWAKLLANLRQDFSGTEYPFFPLDPAYSWHSGAAFWEKKLKHIVKRLCELGAASDDCVRRVVAQHVCAIEMVPYHSRNFEVRDEHCDELESVQLARSFVQELARRSSPGERLFIAMRRVRSWGLDEGSPNVFCFSAGQARGAHLSTRDEEAAGNRAVDMLLPLVQSARLGG